ncbi:phosphate/phosphite/phosphonate ABC transporter substrate-binding protein [Vogesella alkaliphila]|uniref:Phosphonate transport system substrate-binding protein n=1 Tax=Vogesella alkaliphila TaxID=1193621 RepID=A0ABQ2YK44_9NEIS|nr:phosphate/phosphite/phosphonate ABC transporter substrate-binding protein [Vogesella alkaliphila]GGX87015.1 hypothetical protein GCM10011290_13650 [Vogesella alkaliphila]
MAKNLLTAGLLWLCLLASVHAAPALVLGVVPYMSARKLATLYEPLRAELERSLQQPVTLESAADYAFFLERTRQGRYDIIATSPYFGRLAQLEQDYRPLARPLTDLEPLLVTRRDGIRELAQLRGQTVSTSDRLANLTLAAQRYLSRAGFVPGNNIVIRPTGSHANSLAALLSGESAAAIISVSALHQFGGDIGGKIRILARLPHTTPQLYLGHKRLGDARLARLQQQLLTFANDTPQGRAFSRDLNHGGLRPVGEPDMRALDPYVRDLKGLLR